MQKADPLRSVTKEHQEKKTSNCSIGRSITPAGRRTLHQRRLTPFEPDKVSSKVYLNCFYFLFMISFRICIGILMYTWLLLGLLSLELHIFLSVII